MVHTICTTSDGTEVNVDLIRSDAARSIAQQPQLLGFVKEALLRKKLAGQAVHFEYDMGRVIGYDMIVDTPDDSAVFYAQMLRETTYTRFIKGVKPHPSSHIAMVLERSTDGHTYELQDVRIGRLFPPYPGEAVQTLVSKQYWATHAFVYDGQVLKPRTVTKECPY